MRPRGSRAGSRGASGRRSCCPARTARTMVWCSSRTRRCTAPRNRGATAWGCSKPSTIRCAPDVSSGAAGSGRLDRPAPGRPALGAIGAVDIDSLALSRHPAGAEHTLGVELHVDLALAVDRDDSTLAAERRELLHHHLVHGLAKRSPTEAHARTNIVRDCGADEHLAVSGGRYGAAAVVGVGAGADQRRIADPPETLAGH